MYISPNINLASVASAVNMTTALADLTTLTGRLTAGRATNLDNLDTLVSNAEQRKVKAGGPGLITLPDGSYSAIAAGGANAYGAWSQLSAAIGTALLVVGFYTELDGAAVVNNQGQWQIGVGAGGAEVVQETFPLPTSSTTADVGRNWTPLPLPVKIANGSRVAVRGRLSGAAGNWGIWLICIDPANVEKWSA